MICLLIAAVLGLGFRLTFAPARLKTWVSTSIAKFNAEQQKRTGTHTALAFDTAEIRLSQGWTPQFAVVLKGVKVAPSPDCRPEPSLQIAELSLPLRVSRLLFRGQIAVGIVSAADVIVDLDGLKVRCAGAQVVTAPTPLPLSPSQIAATPAHSETTQSKPWWSEKQFRDIEAVVEGVDLAQVEVQFENKSKHLFLDSFSAEIRSGGSIDLATELRIPPEVSYGETVPSLVIEGSATATRADVKVSARVDEGELEANAILTSGADGKLFIDAALGVGELPLSTVVPFIRKVNLASERFHPKFLWVSCSAKIKGPFQKLFSESPLLLEACSVEGDGSKIALSQAARAPNGQWEPFTLNVESLELGKFLKTIGAAGPEGISNQFGKVKGKIRVSSATDAEFKGVLQGAQLSFSSQRVRAQQGVDSADLNVKFDGEKYVGEISNVKLEDGEAEGSVKLQFEHGLKNGRIDVEIGSVAFAPQVQNLLVKGKLGVLTGKGTALINSGRVVDLTSDLEFAATAGRDIRFEKAKLHIERIPERTAALHFSFRGFELSRSSSYFSALTPIFLSHEFEDEWIPFADLRFESLISQEGGFRWKEAQATLLKDQVGVKSSGVMSREHALSGSVEVDYPKVKNLKWVLSGTSALPALTESSSELKKLRERVEITDASLGLVK